MDRPTLPEEPSDAQAIFLPVDDTPRRRAPPKRLLVRRSFGGLLSLGLLVGGAAAGYLMVVVPLREQVAELREQLRLAGETSGRQLAQLDALEKSAARGTPAGPSTLAPGQGASAAAEVLAWSDALTEAIHNSEAFVAASDAGLLKVARAEGYVDLWLLPGALGAGGEPSDIVAAGLRAALAAVGAAPRPSGLPQVAANVWRLAEIPRLRATMSKRAVRTQRRHRGASAPQSTSGTSVRPEQAPREQSLERGAMALRRQLAAMGQAIARVGVGQLSRWPGWAVPPVRGGDERETLLVRLELEPRSR